MFERLAPTLRREAVDVDWIPTLDAGMTLVTEKSFEIIILTTNLEPRTLPEVVGEIRGTESASRYSSIIVLADPDQVDEARELKDRGVNQVMLVDDPPQMVRNQASTFLKVAPRSAVQVPIKLGPSSGPAVRELLCQTENLSTSGMLVRTRRKPEIGSTIDFRINYSTSAGPISGRGETVRHVAADREGLEGVGIRFLSFENDGASRLQEYLKSFGSEDESEPLDGQESDDERRLGGRQEVQHRVRLKLD